MNRCHFWFFFELEQIFLFSLGIECLVLCKVLRFQNYRAGKEHFLYFQTYWWLLLGRGNLTLLLLPVLFCFFIYTFPFLRIAFWSDFLYEITLCLLLGCACMFLPLLVCSLCYTFYLLFFLLPFSWCVSFLLLPPNHKKIGRILIALFSLSQVCFTQMYKVYKLNKNSLSLKNAKTWLYTF